MVQQQDIEIHNTDVSEIISLLERHGVTVVNNYVQGEVLKQLNAEFDELRQNADSNYLKSFDYSNGIGKKLFLHKMPESDFTNTQNFFKRTLMKSVADAYFDHAYVLNEEIYVVNDVVGTKHLANDLHFDVIPTLKFFLYLTDTDASNGAFYCVPGSHTYARELRKEKKISFAEREVTRDLPMEGRSEIPIEAPGGSLIIFSTETFHKAGTVSVGERRVMRGHTRGVELKQGIIQRIRGYFGLN